MPDDAPIRYGPQRDAAARNRAVILEVAHELLASSPAVSLNEVAKRAGVGAGTLYRHFPTREDLILAVYRHDIDRLVASVDPLLEAEAPLDALVTWFEQLAAYVRIKHGLGEALASPAAQRAISDTYAPVTAAIAKLLDAGVAAGSVRAGLDPADVLLLMGCLWRVDPGPEGLDQAHRLLQVAVAGLRA